jgi:integrase
MGQCDLKGQFIPAAVRTDVSTACLRDVNEIKHDIARLATPLLSKRDDSGKRIDHARREVREAMDQYTPRMPAAQWLPIRDFVLEVVSDLQARSPLLAIRQLGVVARYAHWAITVAGMPLNPRDLFHPGNVARFALRQYASPQHRVTAERILRHAAEIYGDPVEPRRLHSSSGPSLPYRVKEIAPLFSWATGQGSKKAGRDAHAILAFCGGAGLRASELLEVRAGDITQRGRMYLVNVRGRFERRVPVRWGWGGGVPLALEGLDHEDLVAFNHIVPHQRSNAIKNFGNRRHAGAPRAQKLRVTWVVDMIAAVPMASLVYAAGYSTPASLAPYMKHASVLPQETLERALRGPEPR